MSEKSILETITDTIKDIADIAADAANHALKEDKPPRKRVEKSGIAHMPLDAEGFVSGPFMAPPIAVRPGNRQRSGPGRPPEAARKKQAGE